MNKNTFLQGFFIGRHLLAGAQNMRVRVTPYNKQDFFNGLACGLLGSVEVSDPDPTGDTSCSIGFSMDEATRTLRLREVTDTGDARYTWNATDRILTADGLVDNEPY